MTRLGKFNEYALLRLSLHKPSSYGLTGIRSGFVASLRVPPAFTQDESFTCVTLYCKSVDSIFGGSRYQQYLENQQKECARLQANVRELKARQQDRAERRFERETVYQALMNPHYVETNRTANTRSFSFARAARAVVIPP